MQEQFDLAAIGAIHDLNNDAVWRPDQIRRVTAARSSALARAGVTAADLVIIGHGGTPAFFADLFAVWRLGACAVCINPGLTAGELETVAAFTEAKALMLSSEDEVKAPRGLPVITEGFEDHDEDLEDVTTLNNDADSPALILFTSGTTGDPKGVVHTFASLRARIDLNHKYIAPETLARTLCVLPTHFGHGLIGNSLTPLFAGGELFLAGGGGMARAAKLGEQILNHRITFMSSVPSFWKMALKFSKPPAEKTLHQVSIGSAPVAAELIEAVREWSGAPDIRNMYGITETANWIAGSSTLERAPEDGLIGTMWGGDAAVRLADGRLAPAGEGEIAVRAPSLMKGYYKRPDLTEDVMREGWYFTGDIGVIGKDGVIRLSGRIKNEINRGGMKVSPEEVDLLLERHAAVDEACAFGLPDPAAGETVAVAIKLAEGSTLTTDELRGWCIERIRRDCVPERWFFLSEIPKTDRGKLNRDKVRRACMDEGGNDNG